jgi:YVTN family beta-propeller protein
VKENEVNAMKVLGCTFALSALLALPLAASSVRIYQTNAGGDEVNVIDTVANKVVLEVKDIEIPHGVAFAPDGTRAYISCEGESTVWATDTKTGNLIGKVALTGHPNNLSVSKDGKLIFVGIVTAPGAVDVADAATLKVIKTIPLKGGVHNTFLTPDGKFDIAGSVAGSLLTVIDAKTLEPVWDHKFDRGVRPMAFERSPDGSTSRVFVELSGYHGFAVLDFKTHEETARIKLPDYPNGGYVGGGAPSHGIIVSPDNKTLWVNSSPAHAVFAYSLPDLKVEGYVAVGAVPDWIAQTPDGKRLYVADSGSNVVSVVDTIARREIARIPVGQTPKRNGMVIVP